MALAEALGGAVFCGLIWELIRIGMGRRKKVHPGQLASLDFELYMKQFLILLHEDKIIIIVCKTPLELDEFHNKFEPINKTIKFTFDCQTKPQKSSLHNSKSNA